MFGGFNKCCLISIRSRNHSYITGICFQLFCSILKQAILTIWKRPNSSGYNQIFVRKYFCFSQKALMKNTKTKALCNFQQIKLLFFLSIYRKKLFHFHFFHWGVIFRCCCCCYLVLENKQKKTNSFTWVYFTHCYMSFYEVMIFICLKFSIYNESIDRNVWIFIYISISSC